MRLTTSSSTTRPPAVEPFIISGGTMTVRRSLVVVLHDDTGHVGYGESPPFELPFYSEETLARRRLTARAGAHSAPGRIGKSGPRGGGRAAPPRAFAATRSPAPRSRRAAWDLEAHRRGTRYRRTARRAAGRRRRPPRIPCGVALGIPADRSTDTLRRWIEQALAHGYRRVKIKVAPGWDGVPVARPPRRSLAGTGIPLTVDANGGYEWPRARARLRALDEAACSTSSSRSRPRSWWATCGSRMSCARRCASTRPCTPRRPHGSCSSSTDPRVWNVKVHRMGGLTEVCRVVRLAREHGARLWAGTMPESGLGSQAALAAAAMPASSTRAIWSRARAGSPGGTDVLELRMAPDGTMEVPRTSIAGRLDQTLFRRASRRLH